MSKTDDVGITPEHLENFGVTPIPVEIVTYYCRCPNCPIRKHEKLKEGE